MTNEKDREEAKAKVERAIDSLYFHSQQDGYCVQCRAEVVPQAREALAILTAEPEPCEDAKVASENLALDVSISGMTIKTIQRHMTAYASQVADKRVEELRAQVETLREALEGLLDPENDTDESYKVAYEVLAATEPKH